MPIEITLELAKNALNSYLCPNELIVYDPKASQFKIQKTAFAVFFKMEDGQLHIRRFDQRKKIIHFISKKEMEGLIIRPPILDKFFRYYPLNLLTKNHSLTQEEAKSRIETIDGAFFCNKPKRMGYFKKVKAGYWREKHGASPCKLALLEGNLNALKASLEIGYPLPEMPILQLAYAKHISKSEIEEIVLYLSELSPHCLQEKDDQGKTPLHWAYKHGNVHLALFLLKHETPAEDCQGNTLLHALAEASDVLSFETAQCLVKAASPYVQIEKENKDKLTPFVYALTQRQLAAAKALLIQGAVLAPKAIDVLSCIADNDIKRGLLKEFFQVLIKQGFSSKACISEKTLLRYPIYLGHLKSIFDAL